MIALAEMLQSVVLLDNHGRMRRAKRRLLDVAQRCNKVRLARRLQVTLCVAQRCLILLVGGIRAFGDNVLGYKRRVMTSEAEPTPKQESWNNKNFGG